MVRTHACILIGIIIGVFAERAEWANEAVYIATGMLVFWSCARMFNRLEKK